MLNEVTISDPCTPLEIANIMFGNCTEDEPQAAVFQQELIIACADLVSKALNCIILQFHQQLKITQRPNAFDGILTVRLSWLTKSLDLLLGYIKDDIRESKKRKEGSAKPLDLVSFLELTCPGAVRKQLGASIRYLLFPIIKAPLTSDLTTDIGVFDLPPTVVKDLLSSMLMRKNWHLL